MMPIAASSVVDYISGQFTRASDSLLSAFATEFYFGNGPELKRHLL